MSLRTEQQIYITSQAKGGERKITAACRGGKYSICPQCAAKYNRAEDVLLLNPSEEQLIDIIAAMYKRRASQLAKVKGRKRKANMSDAVRSLYGPKDGVKKK